MTSGLTPQGFSATTVQEEVDDLNNKFLANVDGALDLSPDQPIGQIISIFSEKFAELMELGATVYNSINPNAAEGQLLANVCSISGTFPQVATFSTVTANLLLAASTTVTAGAIATVAGQPANRWVLIADAVNSGGTTATVSAQFRSEVAGPFVANAHTLTVIGTPTIGWISVDNPADAVAGLPADTDTTLRQRREAELAGEGAGTVDAIRAAVLKVAGVIQAFVFENTSLVTDGTGLPGKAFRVVVWDGPGMSATNDHIAQAIWDHKPSGILSFGSLVGNATDSTGTVRALNFDRAIQKRLYVVCTTTPGTLNTAGTQAVKNALAAYALATFNLGVSVIDLPFRAAALVPGVTTDVPTFMFDFVPSPTNTANLPITGQQIATLQTADILVNGV